jgi:hypothetical protein
VLSLATELWKFLRNRGYAAKRAWEKWASGSAIRAASANETLERYCQRPAGTATADATGPRVHVVMTLSAVIWFAWATKSSSAASLGQGRCPDSGRHQP